MIIQLAILLETMFKIRETMKKKKQYITKIFDFGNYSGY